MLPLHSASLSWESGVIGSAVPAFPTTKDSPGERETSNLNILKS